MEEITNKVKNSGIVTLDLTHFLPTQELVEVDLEKLLWQGLVLKEKDFRAFIAEEDWTAYNDKIVAVHCSADAIVPTWAYMLIASSLFGHAAEVHYGTLNEVRTKHISQKIALISEADFVDTRVVIKGCADIPNPETLFLELTLKLRPVVTSLMYGEPCSTVPVFKKKRKVE